MLSEGRRMWTSLITGALLLIAEPGMGAAGIPVTLMDE
jgi:hypothetical protein